MHNYFFFNDKFITGHVTGIPAEIVMTTEEGHVIEGEAGKTFFYLLNY